MIVKGVVTKFGELIERAERNTIEDMKEKNTEEETSVTDRFFARVQDVFTEHGRSEGKRISR